MSHSTQLEFHPNADSLNDFVEHALPEPERQEILAHLAGCSRCRQVIYFARETPSVLETPMPTVGRLQSPQFRVIHGSRAGVLRGSQLRHVLRSSRSRFLYVRHRVPAPEIAKVVSSASGNIPNPSSPEHTHVEAPHSPVQPAPTKSMAANSLPAPSSIPSKELPHLTEPSDAAQDTDLDGTPPTGPRVKATTPSGGLDQ